MPVSKRNRRGVLILIVLTLLVVYAPRFITWLGSGNKIQMSFEDIKSIETEIVRTKQKSKTNKKKSPYQLPESKFDPNTYTLTDWMKLGLSEKQAAVILKFTKYGIKSNEELKKIFVISDELFALVEDSTFYPHAIENNKVHEAQFDNSLRSVEKIDLNLANAEKLQELPGIGPYYAGKIVGYRSKLGGFISKQQLLEIWKFDALLLEKISDRITIEGHNVKQININSATVEMLYEHPYISYDVANSIIKMREQHGNYQRIEDIRNSKIIDQELFLKLKPYLTI